MYRRDRLTNVALFAAAATAWVGIALLFLNYDPTGNAAVLLAGAILLGAAVGLTLAPLLWLVSFARSGRIAYRGDWWRAARRGALVGLVTTLFVVLQGQGLLSPPLALFVLAMAVFAELTLWLRR
jgi:hypothetical protein